MALNSIRKFKKDFGKKYGQVVICTDNANYWRKSAFKHYKANRKVTRDASEIDWQLVFQVIGELKTEIRNNFPYKVMDVNGAEADDIIGVLAQTFHLQESILIGSGDHDFFQLQIYPGVEQYGTIQNKFLIESDPKRFLLEHIIRGDKGDGIPNFLSADDAIVSGTKQKSIFDSKVEVWITQKPEEFCPDETILANYYRNKKLVDLSQIPEGLVVSILEAYEKPIIGDQRSIYSYMIKNKLVNLLGMIRDF